MRSIESQIADETSEELLQDGSIIDCLDLFARGLYSGEELKNLLVVARDRAQERVIERISGPQDDGDLRGDMDRETAVFGDAS